MFSYFFCNNVMSVFVCYYFHNFVFDMILYGTVQSINIQYNTTAEQHGSFSYEAYSSSSFSESICVLLFKSSG